MIAPTGSQRLRARTTRRLAAVAVLAALAPIAAATSASAGSPPATEGPRTPWTVGSGEFTLSGYCSFDVRIDYTANEWATYTTETGGVETLFASGHATATVTNMTTGKSLSYNISGPGTLTYYDTELDGKQVFLPRSGDLTGPQLLWTYPQNSYTYPDGSVVPSLAYTTGHVKFFVQPNGMTTSYSNTGARTDVCAALT